MVGPLFDVVGAARRLVPCDAVTVLQLEDGVLVPVAADGLRGEAIGRRFRPSEHPRLAQILAARGPVRFTGSDLPDPFDGLFAAVGDVLTRAHACIGCPLVVEDRVIGVLAVDAVSPAAFDDVGDEIVAVIARLAGAAVHAAVLAEAAQHGVERRALVERLLGYEGRAATRGELIGTSSVMVRLRDEIDLLARSDLTALLTGETGTGKELVAQRIHARSQRCDKPLVYVNCAALPESLAESELFGHVRGSFTGALDHRAGKFEIADGGTLLLDEIGEMPLSIQAKLLRVLQTGEVQRIGSDRPLRVDVRVIAATNRDLPAEVAAGRFRSDLFYRLNVYPVHVPPLRDRREDIPLLTGHFLDRARERLGLPQLRVSTGARAVLRAHAWPGNVRELEHTLLRAALRASKKGGRGTVVVDVDHLAMPAVKAAHGDSTQPLRQAVDTFTRELITATVQACDDNWAEAARRLGLQRGNLHRLASRLGLE